MKPKIIFCLLFLAIKGFPQNPSTIVSLRKSLAITKDSAECTKIYHQLAESFLRNDYDSANHYIELSLKNAPNDALKAQSLFLKANYLQDRAKFEDALQYYIKALKIFEKLNNKKGIGEVYNAEGRLYKKMAGAQKVTSLSYKALDLVKKSEAIFVEIKDYENLMSAYNSAGIIYRDLDQYETARTYLKKGLALAEKYKFNGVIVGNLNSNLGQIYMEVDKNQDKAIQQFQKGLEIHQSINNLQGIEHALRNMSHAYRMKKLFPEAVRYGKMAVNLSLTLNDPHRAFNSYEALYSAESDAGNYKDALHSLERFKSLQDSTLRAEKAKIVDEIETKYDTEKKEILIKQLDEKNKYQQIQMWFMVGGLLISMCFLWVLFWQNKKIKDSRQRIFEQSDQLKLMMKELHHRVKNNLAIVSSLLKIQSGRIEDEKAVLAVRQGQQRVEAMSLIHQRLYQTDKVTNINIKEYISDLADSLMSAYGFEPEKFNLIIQIEKEMLDVDSAIPIGLIINELLTNSFKYAYKDIDQPLLKITLKQDNGLTLEVSDNGPGVDMERWKKAKDSFGKKLIAGLTKQIGGTFEMENNFGSHFRLHLPQEKMKFVA